MSSKTNQSILGRLRTSATALRENKVLRRIFRTKTGLIGASITIGLVMVAIFAGDCPVRSDRTELRQRKPGPSLSHPFGTDRFGRDIFSRVIYGSRYALGLGVGIVAIQVLIGVPLGLIAGYYGATSRQRSCVSSILRWRFPESCWRSLSPGCSAVDSSADRCPCRRRVAWLRSPRSR